MKTRFRVLTGFLCFALMMALMLPVRASAASAASSDLSYVYDMAGILSEEEASDLEMRAEAMASAYGIGVYIITVDDYREYADSSAFDAAEAIADQLNLGIGEDLDSEMLLMSMDDRDYALRAHGYYANRCFTDYGQEKLEEQFLDDFRDNSWYSGFQDYMTVCENYLDMGSKGQFFDVDSDPANKSMTYGLSLIGGVFAGLITLFVTRKSLRSAAVAKQADSYKVPGSFKLSGRSDRFINRTVTRRRIEKQNKGGGGGTTINSHGSSGHSGKF